MNRVTPCLLAAVATVAGCASDPDPWVASGKLAADAPLQATTMIARFAAPLDENCAPGLPPSVEIVTPGALGDATVGSAPQAVSDVDDPCFETVVPGTGVFYTPTAAGFDRLVLREAPGGGRPDVFHDAEVRVR